IDVARFVRNPFAEDCSFDFEAFGKVVATSIRMLDNALHVTPWPLPQQKKEASNKRRVGLGFTGLGDALLMLRLAYDRQEARPIACKVSEHMRDRACEASVELPRERGAFPLCNADLHRSGGNFASRLPQEIKDRIRNHGIRSSHVISI